MEGFTEVKNQITSLIKEIFERVSDANMVQMMAKISSGKWAKIVLIPPWEVETQSEDVDASLQ